jgi:hypothetical protein
LTAKIHIRQNKKETNMKTKMKTMLVILAAGTTAFAASAQDDNTNAPQHEPAFGPGGRHPPVPAIVLALDVNHDGVIDSNEIANASAELKTLDKNGDGQLTRDEYLGKRPGPPPDSDRDNAGPPPDDAPPMQQ